LVPKLNTGITWEKFSLAALTNAIVPSFKLSIPLKYTLYRAVMLWYKRLVNVFFFTEQEINVIRRKNAPAAKMVLRYEIRPGTISVKC
jgi:hypothetical protein